MENNTTFSNRESLGDWVADWEDNLMKKYIVRRSKNDLIVDIVWNTFNHLSFENTEQAEFSLTHHRELWEKYWMP